MTMQNNRSNTTNQTVPSTNPQATKSKTIRELATERGVPITELHGTVKGDVSLLGTITYRQAESIQNK